MSHMKRMLWKNLSKIFTFPFITLFLHKCIKNARRTPPTQNKCIHNHKKMNKFFHVWLTWPVPGKNNKIPVYWVTIKQKRKKLTQKNLFICVFWIYLHIGILSKYPCTYSLCTNESWLDFNKLGNMVYWNFRCCSLILLYSCVCFPLFLLARPQKKNWIPNGKKLKI